MKPRQWILMIALVYVCRWPLARWLKKSSRSRAKTPQTKVIGTDWLVSVEGLPAMDGQMSLSPESAPETLMAGASTPENLMALLQPRSATGQAGAGFGPTPPAE